ncbi:PHP domain-containing protein [Gemmatimonadota bacterium]
MTAHGQIRRFTVGAAVLLVFTACSAGSNGEWYRGNMHTHSLWSDGDAAPETVVAWYKENGYDWLSLTDHDVLLQGERWYPITDDGRLTPARVQELRETFGENRVVTRDADGVPEMRLKTLEELRNRFEAPGDFLLIEGEEITDRSEGKPLHFNVLNPAAFIPTQGGETVNETVERDLRAVNQQAEQTGRNMLVHLNHPNYGWALSPEQLAMMEGTHLFEVYNGSTECNNNGDSTHASMDEAWDLANMIRLTQLDLGPLYGVANDDTHNYFEWAPNRSNPGRGWIMVRAESLSTDAILNSLRAGDFYSSTGVELKDVQVGPDEYVVKIAAERGITYTTQFIGTQIAHGIPGKTGVVLHETTETTASYSFRGDELYVRAKVISSRMQVNPVESEMVPEQAWTQPVVPETQQQ